MNPFFTYSFYALAAVSLLISAAKDRRKTQLALKKAWKMFINVLPHFIGILIVTGLALALLPPEIIERTLGRETGPGGMLTASLAGAVTLVPVMVVFPVVSELLNKGAGVAQMAVFISTLTTVGIATLPLEIKYLGRRAALLRNLFAFIFSFAAAGLMGVLAI